MLIKVREYRTVTFMFFPLGFLWATKFTLKTRFGVKWLGKSKSRFIKTKQFVIDIKYYNLLETNIPFIIHTHVYNKMRQ